VYLSIDDVGGSLKTLTSEGGSMFKSPFFAELKNLHDRYDAKFSLYCYALTSKFFIVCEGFNTPPFRALNQVLNPETNTLPKQHTSPFRAWLLISELSSSFLAIGRKHIVAFTHEWCFADVAKKIEKALSFYSEYGYKFIA
jgi:hypothetical protein